MRESCASACSKTKDLPGYLRTLKDLWSFTAQAFWCHGRFKNGRNPLATTLSCEHASFTLGCAQNGAKVGGCDGQK